MKAIFILMTFSIINFSYGVDISDKFINALIQKESSGRNNIIDDKHLRNKAYGCLQIRINALTDANMVLKTNYKLTDMFDRNISIKVCKAYLTHYGKWYERKTGNNANYIILARIWNGGPTGWIKGNPNTKQRIRFNNTTRYSKAIIAILKRKH